MESLVEVILESAKETTIEAIKSGASAEECFEFLSSKFDDATARMILIDIGLDLGIKKEVKEYVAGF